MLCVFSVVKGACGFLENTHIAAVRLILLSRRGLPISFIAVVIGTVNDSSQAMLNIGYPVRYPVEY